MIDPKTLTESDLGRKVIYHREFCDRQEGELTSWNEKYVRVRFKGPNGESREPADVTFAIGHGVELDAVSHIHEDTRPMLFAGPIPMPRGGLL